MSTTYDQKGVGGAYQNERILIMNNDITILLYRIKENIHAIEEGEIRESFLEEVYSDFLDMIELMKLFLISERDSYYGYFLMNMQFHANFLVNSIAGIRLNTFPPIFEANPLLLCKFSLKEILYIICHEIDHVVWNHPAEMIKSNPSQDPDIFYRFNLAADAAVNDQINYEIQSEKHGFLSCPDSSITSDVLSRIFHLGRIAYMENYAYYFNLLKGKVQQPHTPQNGGQFIIEEQKKKENLKEDRQGIERQVITAKNCGSDIIDHNWEAGNDAEDAAAAVRELVNAAVGIMNEETRGRMSASFIGQVEELNKPPVLSWQVILKKYIGTITANKQKTRMRLNRRQPERFDLSGTTEDKVLKIVVAIDTSGSVEDAMISQIFHEIFAILAKRKHDITIIECDSKIRRVYKAKTSTDIKRKVVGRGGTWFSPVIEYINKDRYFRDALLIYFTDGYGENTIPKPRTYRNIWVVIGDASHLSVKEPYGAVLTL